MTTSSWFDLFFFSGHPYWSRNRTTIDPTKEHLGAYCSRPFLSKCCVLITMISKIIPPYGKDALPIGRMSVFICLVWWKMQFCSEFKWISEWTVFDSGFGFREKKLTWGWGPWLGMYEGHRKICESFASCLRVTCEQLKKFASNLGYLRVTWVFASRLRVFACNLSIFDSCFKLLGCIW